MKLNLVDDWRRAWTWFSVQAMVVATAIEGAWTEFPQTMQTILPESVAHKVAVAALFLGIFGRLLKQGKAKP